MACLGLYPTGKDLHWGQALQAHGVALRVLWHAQACTEGTVRVRLSHSQTAFVNQLSEHQRRTSNPHTDCIWAHSAPLAQSFLTLPFPHLYFKWRGFIPWSPRSIWAPKTSWLLAFDWKLNNTFSSDFSYSNCAYFTKK